VRCGQQLRSADHLAGSYQCVLPERSHLVREAGRRLFAVSKMHADLWADEADAGFAEPRAGGTKLPLNIDEAELPDGSGPDPFILPDETKRSAPTRNTLVIHLERVASLVRELKAAQPAAQREPAFVLELHAKCRQLIDVSSSALSLHLLADTRHLPGPARLSAARRRVGELRACASRRSSSPAVSATTIRRQHRLMSCLAVLPHSASSSRKPCSFACSRFTDRS
jgi:hypothetical protein